MGLCGARALSQPCREFTFESYRISPLYDAYRGELKARPAPSRRDPALRAAAAAAGHLGPGVAQAHGAVEHQPLGCGILVRTEIAEPLELHRVIGIAAG